MLYRDRVVNTPTASRPISKQGLTVIKGLEYQNQAFEDEYTWHDAKDYCKALNLHGTGWRMPNLHELHQILLTHQNSNLKDRPHYIHQKFVENMPKNSWFWSSIKHNKDFSGVWGCEL